MDQRMNSIVRQAVGRWALGVLALALMALPAAAQTDTGALYGTVTTPDGSALPGVTVTVTGPGAPRVFVTGADGAFRFLGLEPGTYDLATSLDGYSPVEYADLDIRAGRNYTFEVEMDQAVQETIVVTSAAPVLDERKISQGVSISEQELDQLPTSRDPWAFVTHAPGVVTDRINVGGNESGQQPNFVGTGALSDQNVFSVDGVNITDFTALGGSSTYFGFEQFEEVDISTGGTDVTLMSPGVQVNLITKRGTNDWRGSARYFLTDEEAQAGNNLDRADLGEGQELDADGNPVDPASLTPNQVREIADWGAELGGPILRDRLWIWGGYDKNDITQSVFGGLPDNTILENYTAKLNGQITPSTSAVLSYNWGDKIKSGRDAGPDRPPETTWNQTGPTEIWKAQLSHVFSPNFVATATYGLVDGGFVLAPLGGTDVQGVIIDALGVAHNSYLFLDTDRNSSEYGADGAYYFNAAGASHELKFGGQFREHENLSNYGFPGGQLGIDGSVVGLPEGLEFVQLWRNQNAINTVEYESLWLQDTVAFDRLTLSAGLRYDVQSATNDPVRQVGAIASPNLGDIDFAGNDSGGFEWDTVSPRLGLTWALGEQRNTLLRASYSRFASQLGSSIPLLVNPTKYAYGSYAFVDDDGDLLVDPTEEPSLIFLSPVNFDPADPNSVVSPHVIDPGLGPELTDEAILGVEREMFPGVVVAGRVMYRQSSDLLEDRAFVRDASGAVRLATRDDYVLDAGGLDPELDPDGNGTIQGTLPGGASYDVPIFRLRDGLSLTGGSLYVNGDRETGYLGTSLSMERRLADGWSLRGYLNFYDWEWEIGDEFRRFDDPTDEDNASSDPIEFADDDGAIVAEQSGGSGNVTPFMNSKWSLGLSGMVELPLGLNLSANVMAREGFPVPYFRTVTASDGRDIDVQLVDEVDSERTDDLYLLDLGLDREFALGDTSVTLRLDGFNLLNEGFVLQRERDAGTGRASHIDQIVGPRIFRLGVKLRLR